MDGKMGPQVDIGDGADLDGRYEHNVLLLYHHHIQLSKLTAPSTNRTLMVAYEQGLDDNLGYHESMLLDGNTFNPNKPVDDQCGQYPG
jgi:hypothetical protein